MKEWKRTFNEVRRVLLIASECEHDPHVKWESLEEGGVFTALTPYGVEGCGTVSVVYEKGSQGYTPVLNNGVKEWQHEKHAGQCCHGNGKLMNEWYMATGRWESVKLIWWSSAEACTGRHVFLRLRTLPSLLLLCSPCPCAAGWDSGRTFSSLFSVWCARARVSWNSFLFANITMEECMRIKESRSTVCVLTGLS